MISTAQFSYSPMPEGFDHRPMRALALKFWMSRRPGSPVLPKASLYVTDGEGNVLADVPCARRTDFRLRISLPSTDVIVDLYVWYLMWAIYGGWGNYNVQNEACHTFVKFGKCMQHTRLLLIRIAPAPEKGSK